MSTVYGVNKTKARTPESGSSNIVDGGLMAGRRRVMYDSYEAAAIVAGTIIEMGDKLPKGAHVIDVELMADALGSSVTLIAGDYEDDNRYIAVSSTWNSANQRQRINAIDGMGYKIDETTEGDTSTDRQIIVTTGAATATGTIKIAITFTQD